MKPKQIINPDYEDAEPVHFISHPDSGIVCQCAVCRASHPITPIIGDKGKIGRIYFYRTKPMRFVFEKDQHE